MNKLCKAVSLQREAAFVFLLRVANICYAVVLIAASFFLVEMGLAVFSTFCGLDPNQIGGMQKKAPKV